MITYHLADSLPAEVARRLHSELGSHSHAAYRKRIETYLDSGYGNCILKHEEIAKIVANAWQHFDGDRYDLQAWVIMPNHVHVIIQMREISLSTIIHSWKSYTTRMINLSLGRSGPVWHKDYWDRFIRDENHYVSAMNYVRQNPVKAGLVQHAEEWPWMYMTAAGG